MTRMQQLKARVSSMYLSSEEEMLSRVSKIMHSSTKREIAQALHERRSIREYLRQLTDLPEELMRILKDTKTLLSGSRAAAFFYPPAAVSTSVWDFFLAGRIVHICSFLTCTKEALGIVWTNAGIKKVSMSWTADTTMLCSIHGTLDSQGKKHNIRATWIMNRPAIQLVAMLGCTVPQCFIVGNVAVSMYHYLSFYNRMMIHNTATTEDMLPPSLALNTELVYDKRGFSRVQNRINPRQPLKTRSFADTKSMTIVDDEARLSCSIDPTILSAYFWHETDAGTHSSTLSRELTCLLSRGAPELYTSLSWKMVESLYFKHKHEELVESKDKLATISAYVTRSATLGSLISTTVSAPHTCLDALREDLTAIVPCFHLVTAGDDVLDMLDLVSVGHPDSALFPSCFPF